MVPPPLVVLSFGRFFEKNKIISVFIIICAQCFLIHILRSRRFQIWLKCETEKEILHFVGEFRTLRKTNQVWKRSRKNALLAWKMFFIHFCAWIMIKNGKTPDELFSLYCFISYSQTLSFVTQKTLQYIIGNTV